MTEATVVTERLRIGTGFTEADRARILGALGGLDPRLRSFQPDQVELEVSVKDRDGRDQRATLECWLAGLPRLVATSRERDLDAALTELREDLLRQIDDAKTRREPRNNRQLRRSS